MNIHLNIHLNIHCHFNWRWIYRTLVIQAIHEYLYEYSRGYDPQMLLSGCTLRLLACWFPRQRVAALALLTWTCSGSRGGPRDEKCKTQWRKIIDFWREFFLLDWNLSILGSFMSSTPRTQSFKSCLSKISFGNCQ